MRKTEQKQPNIDNISWIGIDLDGTLAYWDKNRWELDKNYIGEPIREILLKAKELVKQNIRIKIFTAKADDEKVIPYIRAWLVKNGLPEYLEITNIKDWNMIELWDDKAKQVIMNSGIFIEDIMNRLIYERKIISRQDYYTKST